MRFWDSSAIVPLVVEESSSPRCRALLRSDPVMIVWCLSRTEVLSALWRQARSGLLDDKVRGRAIRRLDLLAARWAEIDALPLVRDAAERLLGGHALRTGDALQLGAALVAAEHRARGRPFVSLDTDLILAASREGFDVVRPD